MNKDSVQGNLQQAKGAVKETLGKVTGNKSLQAEGMADKAAGKAQESYGDAKDAAKDAADKLRK
ncbi:CsbD family protein [Pseudacidovorax sp. RU35E]|uniref:CsbD family protein n=1 Tax=Pseudacidovorax sp. RU35E TaxID=1907403 RepID=UPI000956BD4E|nr:CsbD family protein [Pseudacidovorax sp. RU35E]SIR39882.1 Uncharacterized conserved protein YjbJ, UPF0337 family [Pseudacidovorax sp. RU35E]